MLTYICIELATIVVNVLFYLFVVIMHVCGEKTAMHLEVFMDPGFPTFFWFSVRFLLVFCGAPRNFPFHRIGLDSFRSFEI